MSKAVRHPLRRKSLLLLCFFVLLLIAWGGATAWRRALDAQSSTASALQPAASPPATPEASSPAGPKLFGLHMDLTYEGSAEARAGAIARAKAIHAQVSRNSLLWHKIEPRPGARDWRRTDSVVDGLLAAGIAPLLVIYGSPAWANGVNPSADSFYFYVPTDPGAFKKWLQSYESFVEGAVRRYRGKVRRWELWNEQNLQWSWKPAPNVDQYVAWYRAIFRAIKAIDPDAEVALGGLAGGCCAAESDYSGNRFLQEVYKRGVRPEIVALHPYPDSRQAPDVHVEYKNNFDDIGLIHDTMVAQGSAAASLWVTEWGWPTNEISEARQATYVEKSLRMIANDYPYVTLATYFLDFDRPPEYFHGLYTSDFRLKEAGVRFREFMAKRR